MKLCYLALLAQYDFSFVVAFPLQINDFFRTLILVALVFYIYFFPINIRLFGDTQNFNENKLRFRGEFMELMGFVEVDDLAL